MTDKTIRISLGTWQKLRAAAYQQNSHIKTMLEDIMAGRIDPVSIKIK